MTNEEREKEKAIETYIKLIEDKQKFMNRWGWRKSWPKQGQLDHAFRVGARLGILKEIRARLIGEVAA